MHFDEMHQNTYLNCVYLEKRSFPRQGRGDL